MLWPRRLSVSALVWKVAGTSGNPCTWRDVALHRLHTRLPPWSDDDRLRGDPLHISCTSHRHASTSANGVVLMPKISLFYGARLRLIMIKRHLRDISVSVGEVVGWMRKLAKIVLALVCTSL